MKNDSKRITTAKTLADHIDAVIAESLGKARLYNNALEEKERQASTAGAIKTTLGSDSSESTEATKVENEEASGDNVKPSKTFADDTDTLKTGEVKVEDVVEKLNAIRSGRSFKDEGIESAMEQYVNSLSKAERTALLTYVSAIAQLVTGMVSGTDAPEPNEPPANVEMKKEKSGKVVHVQPNVIKAPPKEQKKEKSAEDTSAPVGAPIKPKKR